MGNQDKSETRAEIAARQMADFANSGSGSGVTGHFVDAMSRVHCTLQQNFTRLCVAWLEHLGSQDVVDERNEDSIRLGKSFVKMVPLQRRALRHV